MIQSRSIQCRSIFELPKDSLVVFEVEMFFLILPF